MAKLLDLEGLNYFWTKVKSWIQGYSASKSELNQKLDILINGLNIKTINNEPILGSGNINIQNELTFDDIPTEGSSNPVTSDGIYNALQDKVNVASEFTEGNIVSFDENGNLYDSGSKASDFIVRNAVLVTCSELATLRSNSELLPRQKYRITDYSCGYMFNYSENAGHQFDIIVTALSNNELDKNAKATHHTNSEQDYFYYCDLSAWEVEFELLDAYDEYLHEHGKILRLKDEWNNECPYDFKNLKFKRSLSSITRDNGITGDIYLYTFSGVESSAPYNVIELSVLRSNPDYTPSLFLVFDNVLKLDSSQDSNFYYPMNGTVFFDFYDTGGVPFPLIYNNKLCCISGGDYGNTFEGVTYNNIFNDWCTSNKFYTCNNNIFYGRVVNNIADTKGNGFGFSGNVIYGHLFNNVINEGFINNIIYSSDFGSNTIGSYFQNNVIVGLFDANILGNHIQNSKVTDGLLYCNVTGGTSSSNVEFVTITGDVKGTSSNDMLTITFTPDISKQIATLKDDPSGQLTPAQRLIIWKATDVIDKADKVSNSTNGNLAGLDANGNLTDSGYAPSDFALNTHVTTKVVVSDIMQVPPRTLDNLQVGDIVVVDTDEGDETWIDESYQEYVVTYRNTSGESDTSASDAGIEEQLYLTRVSNRFIHEVAYTRIYGSYDPQDDFDWYAIVNDNRPIYLYHRYSTIVNGTASVGNNTITVFNQPLSSTTEFVLEDYPGGVGAIPYGPAPNYRWSFDTGNTIPNITWPTQIQYWKGGSSPTIKPNTHYEITVVDWFAECHSTDSDTVDISGKADKVTNATSGNFAGLDSNGNLTDSGYKATDFLTQHQDISGKADKVANATNGNLAGLDNNGNLTDSGSKASDFATAAQGALADTAYQKPSTGIPASDLASGVIPDISGKEDTSNKVSTITGNETSTSKYPNTKAVADYVVNKADKTSVVTLTGISVTQEMADNAIYQCTTLSSLTITTPNSITSDYISQINFTSGSTATTLTAPNTIVWFGDDLTNNVFVPTTDKQYVVMLYSDGVNVRGVVQSYASQQNS